MKFLPVFVLQLIRSFCLELSQYEYSEILHHEDRRSIVRDTKSVFWPELEDLENTERCKRQEQPVFDSGDFRILDEEHVNLTGLGIVPNSWPEISNASNERNGEQEDRSVLRVQVNISRLQQLSDSEGRCLLKKQQSFWHNQMSKEEIRNLQSSIMRRYMDKQSDPCSDFYSYACGNWKNYFKIPPDRSSYDTFEIIRENLDLVLNDILKEAPAGVPTLERPRLEHLFEAGQLNNNTLDATVKAKLFYQSCMDELSISKRANQPLADVLQYLGGWPIVSQVWAGNREDLLRLLNNDVLISQWVGPDMKNANQYVVHVDQTSLGLPSRDYFLDPKNIKYVRAYKILIMASALLLGACPQTVEQQVDDLVELETSLAEIMASGEERRNISDVYLKTDLASMSLYFPQYDWKTYFDLVLGPEVSLRTPVAVYSVKYLLELVHVLSNSEYRTIQNYLIWRFVHHRLINLDSRFLDVKQRFNFVLFGREKQPPRWQFCVSQVNTHMGMAIGALFVRRYFDETSKKDTIQMTQALVGAFKNILEESTWLDDHTKSYARMKIDSMDLKIGFPDFVLNTTELSMRYYDVDIHPEYFFENVLSILRHMSRSEQKRLRSEVNRTLWSTSPAVVNAYYSRNKNQIMFPAGILQPPFYHKHFPKAMNFGGIGVAIGHEITHGFDDKGRLFDQQGNLMMWWRDASIRNFYEKAQCIIDQYSQYVLPQIKMPIDGYLTQGENIADNGGIKQSFRAYQEWLSRHPGADESLPGLNLTGKQLFFLNFAQVWCGQQRIEEAKYRLKTSVHSPGIFRIIGVLSNSEDFAREFHCPKNSPMNPEKKCTIW
ncbi:hypothetical protein D910_06687 [Dendroctonus ponderosae]|uniref:Peptidase M13 C-terminal domain-containing protein n=1 Tax=Dendroctonus ponderosae TaxID=77166 RepID=U4UHE4_DENPD|nr:hypothetical protein D910_06687 [Dendroctonus ponderosae]